MPYTLVKGLAWVVLALVLGGVVGWLLSSLRSHRQIAKARAATGPTAPLRESLTGRAGTVAVPSRRARTVVVERDRLLVELQQIVAERARVRPAISRCARSSMDPFRGRGATASTRPPTPDIAAAAAVLGRRSRSTTCNSWAGSGPTSSSCVTGSASERGSTCRPPRSRCCARCCSTPGRASPHDPSTWPEQARLLTEGRWQEFKELSEAAGAGSPNAESTAE